MIYSYNKTRDLQMRAEILDSMEIALKHGFIEEAKDLGASAVRLKERIQNHDYTKDDARSASVDKLLRNCTNLLP